MRLAARAQEQAAEAAAQTAVSTVPGLDGPAAGSGGSPRHYQSMVARLMGASNARGSSGAAGSRTNLSDLELEVLAARRAALNRLGRDPTFFGPPASAAIVAAEQGRSSNNAAEGGEQQQQQDVTAAEQRMMAAVRAMVRAALINASVQQQRTEAAAADSAADNEAPARLSGVV